MAVVGALALAAILLVPAAARCDWGPDGVRVSFAPGNQVGPTVLPDASGGWFVGWADGETLDLFLQRLDANGNVSPGWPEGGITVCAAPNDQSGHTMIADGHGGVVFIWQDNRNGLVSDYDIYVQRILATGIPAPGWPVNGLALSSAPGIQFLRRIAVDGGGGIVAAWDHQANSGQPTDVYAARVLLHGTIDPSWPVNGRLIAGGPDWQMIAGVVPDGSGGTIIVWADDAAPEGFASYALRLGPDGSVAPGWQPQGNLIAVPGAANQVIPDEQGGLYAALLDPRTAPPESNPGFYFDLYLQRVRGNGTLAEGWPLDGKPVAVADLYQQPVVMAPDHQGGVYMAWRDARNYWDTATDIYAQRITPAGDPAPGWPANGLPACSFPFGQEDPSIAVDAIGRVVIGFQSNLDSRVYMQHLTAAGALVDEAAPSGWSVTTGPTLRQERIRLGADAFGNVVAAWEDMRIRNNSDIYAKRVVTALPTATTIALVNAEADPSRVRLEWHAAGVPIAGAAVYRREETSAWTSLGAPHILRDRVTFEDAAVTAGRRYAYRLGYAAATGEAFTTETWVDVPAAHRFALAGAQPNPAVDQLTVAFSLASSEPAELELFDLSGRRVACQSFRSPPPGTRRVRLLDARRLDPGVYWLRLRQGSSQARSRVVVVRQ